MVGVAAAMDQEQDGVIHPADRHQDALQNVVPVDGLVRMDRGYILEQLTDMNSPGYAAACRDVHRIRDLEEERMWGGNDGPNDRYRLTSASAIKIRLTTMQESLNNPHRIVYLTGYPVEVFEGILHSPATDSQNVAQFIEARLAEHGQLNYPVAWALLETMYYLADGGTFEHVSNVFLNGEKLQEEVIRIVMRALVHKLRPPTVSV